VGSADRLRDEAFKSITGEDKPPTETNGKTGVVVRTTEFLRRANCCAASRSLLDVCCAALQSFEFAYARF
jgi:hypothetical protein